jgi:hypothetical protein
VEGDEMIGSPRKKPSLLFWDTSHLVDEVFDASIVKFDGWQNTLNLIPPFTYDLPDEICFEANFRTLDWNEYPYNSVRWPIMSERMLQCLIQVGNFDHEVVHVTMIDDTVRSKNRYGSDGRLKPRVARRDLIAVKILYPLDVFDWDRSKYTREEDFPDFASNVHKWVLKTPDKGFPPLFRVSANPVHLFVSSPAREALESLGVKGIELQDVVENTL